MTELEQEVIEAVTDLYLDKAVGYGTKELRLFNALQKLPPPYEPLVSDEETDPFDEAAGDILANCPKIVAAYLRENFIPRARVEEAKHEHWREPDVYTALKVLLEEK